MNQITLILYYQMVTTKIVYPILFQKMAFQTLIQIHLNQIPKKLQRPMVIQMEQHQKY